MHPASADSSPSSEFDFDAASKYSTAWDAAPSRKARKQYGKTNSQKKEARRRGNQKRTLRRSESVPLVSDPISRTFGFDATNRAFGSDAFLRSSSSSINEESEFGPPMSKPRRQLTRSKSVTAIEAPHHRSNHHRQQSFSALMRSASLLSSSSTLLSEFDFEHEKHNPNEGSTSSSSHNAGFGSFGTPPPQQSKNRLLAQLSTMDEHPKSRPRKIRALSNYDDLQRNFSDLARDAEATTSWDDATPNNSTSLAFDFGDFESSSPPGSVTTVGSRKRGVCGSTGGDDMSLSSQGCDHRRTKSRSRIYSPDFPPMMESVRSLNDAKPTKKMNRILRKQVEVDSDDGGESCNSDDGMISCDQDKSFDSTSFDFESLPSVAGISSMSMPPLSVRRSPPRDFESSIFGAARTRETKVLSNECIVEGMPSAEDLKFIIKNLRKAQKGASATFGKLTTWTVSLPSQWPSERRAKILQWTSQDLGFSMRTGGPSVVFLNVSASRAPDLLMQLESALAFHRKQNPGKLPKAAAADKPPSIIFQKISPVVTSSVRRRRGYRQSTNFDALEDDLVQAVNSLDLSTPDPSRLQPSALLVRTITVDPHQDTVSAQPPRHSGEHCVGGIDFVNHMHVVSPRRSRAPRVSCPRTCPRTVTRAPRLSIETAVVAASPFVTSGSKLAFAECVATPHMTRRTCWERPKNSRDWGASTKVPDHILKELTARFEAVFATDGQAMEDNSSTSVFFELSDTNISSHGVDRSMDEVDEENDSDSGSNEEQEDQFEDDLEDELEKEAEEDTVDLDAPPQVWGRRSSVGASAFGGLNLNELNTVVDDERVNRRRMGSMAKHKRVSLCTNTIQTRKSHRPSTNRSSYFSGAPRLSMMEMTLTDSNRFSFVPNQPTLAEDVPELSHDDIALANSKILLNVLSFLDEAEILCRASPVCTLWADVSTEAHATLMLSSVGCIENAVDGDDDDLDDDEVEDTANASIMRSMEKSWRYMVSQYPWACFLSEGAFKRVYKVWNASTQSEEALSVMDIELIESTGNKNVVGAELAVSAMLSSLVRRNICPNFVLTRRVFTCPYEPPASHWGCEEDKKPKGSRYNPTQARGRKPREPQKKAQGKYQYMRMELCAEGDAEEYLKRQPLESISCTEARQMLFQVAFALHAAADRFSLKHYDMKLLNVFLQRLTGIESETTVMRYGLGSHIFALEMPTASGIIAKIADYGTANVQAESNGQPATIGQFTTLENTPPEFMIIGDSATQGHGHDAFGFGLCMLHLFTGHAPYEEILEDVICPPDLKRKLKRIWEDEEIEGYSVIQSLVLADVHKDEDGVIIEGEPDGVLYDTIYRFLVLFGIPENKYKIKENGKVWKAIITSLEGGGSKGRVRAYGRNNGTTKGPDSAQFEQDQMMYSVRHGSNDYITRARRGLEEIEGGMELLFSLVEFNPENRASVCDVLNSQFMIPLREDPNKKRVEDPSHNVMNFMAYLTTS